VEAVAEAAFGADVAWLVGVITERVAQPADIDAQVVHFVHVLRPHTFASRVPCWRTWPAFRGADEDPARHHEPTAVPVIGDEEHDLVPVG
jgi:hypothetical protein